MNTNLSFLIWACVILFISCDNRKGSSGKVEKIAENELKSQNPNQPEIQWEKSYSGSGEESHPHFVIQTSDNGFFIGRRNWIYGRSFSNNSGC